MYAVVLFYNNSTFNSSHIINMPIIHGYMFECIREIAASTVNIFEYKHPTSTTALMHLNTCTCTQKIM